MSLNNLITFNSAVDQAKKNAMDYISIQQAQQNLDQNQQKFDLTKKQAALDLEKSGMDNEDTAMNLKAKKAYMDQLFGTQQDVLDGHQAMIDQQEQKTVTAAKQAHSVAAQLFNTDPDVRNYATSGAASGTTGVQPQQQPQGGAPSTPAGPSMSLAGGGQGPDPTMTPASAPVADGIQNQGQPPDQNIAGAYKSSGAMTVPGPQGSMIVGGDSSNSNSNTSVNSGTGALFGLNDQQGGGGGSLPAQTQPQIQPQQTDGSLQSNATGNATTTAGLPPLSQVYQGLSTKPFGQATSDIYMKNPNFMEAIKNGNYLIKKDPTQIESENPLALNENDRTVLSDIPNLQKAGYGQSDIFNQLTPGTQSLIKTVGEYRATPAELTSSFGGGRQKQELVKAVQAFYPKWSDAVYDQRHRSLIDFTDPNGVNGQTIAATRQGIEHTDELTSSIDAVSNKTISGPFGRQIPVLNAPMNNIMQYVGGDPDILALKQNINAVSEEMTKSWGGARAGEARLKNWRDTMSATNSPQGWSGLLSKTAKLWQEAANTRESMFSLAMGGQKMQDVLGQGVITPDQQAILDRIKGGYKPNNPNDNQTGGLNVPAGRVGVIGPDGKKYSLPQEQLQQAMQQGYKKI